MTKLERMKIDAELAGVNSAKLNMSVRIQELSEEISRLEEHIKIQELREKELKEKLK